jgi:general secretion pathway protein C
MLNILHSFYRPTCLTLFVLLGLACGHLVDTLLQLKFRPTVTTAALSTRSVERPSSKTVEADLNLILQNNIFDAGNRSAAATMTRTPASASGNDAAPVVRADLKLFGTVVAGDLSQALIEANKELKLYHLGDKVPGDGTLENILRNQVTIKNRDQSLTILTLYDKGPVSGQNDKAPVSGRATTSAADTNRNVGEGVREVGENRWMISKSTIESVRENFADQLRLAQMQPRTVNGKTDGFLVQRINPRSLLTKLGVQRGDVIMDVNGIKLDSPEKALQVFQQLREARQISVAVERNGQPMSFAYEIE